MHQSGLTARASALAVIILAVALVLTATPFTSSFVDAQAWETPEDPDGLLDEDLLAALRHLGLEDWWVTESGLDPRVAFVKTTGSSVSEPLRSELIRLSKSVIEDQAALALAGLKIRSAEIAQGNVVSNLTSITDRRVEVVDRRAQRQGEEISLLEALEKTNESINTALPGSLAAIEAGIEREQSLTSKLDETTSDRRSVDEVLNRLDLAESSLNAEIARFDADVAAHRETIADLVERRSDLREYGRVVAANLIESRATQLVPKTGLRLVVLGAYVNGSRSGAACGLDWALLGGIGWIESHHGTYRGATVTADGTLSSPLLGIRLDGSNSAVIRDTDGGRLDGDVSYDRAVGPMQFIPSTWARHSADGDRDGIADPQNLNDAAATAAQYLCRVGGPNASLRTRILGYNNSNKYVDDVLAAAAQLRTTTLPTVR